MAAQEIVRALWKNGERYHAGAIGYAEWGERNKALWRAAERAGVADDVVRLLRRAR